MDQANWEKLTDTLSIYVTPEHKFGTDAFLLSDFAARANNPRSSLRGLTACDLGTGCGIIPLLWFRGAPPPRQIWCVDIQPKAIAQLEHTLEVHQKENRQPELSPVIPLLADIRMLGRGDSPIPAGSCDLITCNPPYKQLDSGAISRGSADQIARHETQCTILDICQAASRLLRFGGRICLCQRPERLADVLEAMRQCHLEPKRLRFVQQREHTAPWLFLVEGKLGSKPFLQVEAPLVIEDPRGGFSPEMLRIYQKEHRLVR